MSLKAHGSGGDVPSSPPARSRAPGKAKARLWLSSLEQDQNLLDPQNGVGAMVACTQLANADKGYLARTALASQQTPEVTATNSLVVPGWPHLNDGTQAPNPPGPARMPGPASARVLDSCANAWLPRATAARPRDFPATGPANINPGTSYTRRTLLIAGHPCP